MKASKINAKSRRPLKRFTVTAIESVCYSAVIHAKDAAAAEEQAWQFWESIAADVVFRFQDSSFDGFYVEEDLP